MKLFTVYYVFRGRVCQTAALGHCDKCVRVQWARMYPDVIVSLVEEVYAEPLCE